MRKAVALLFSILLLACGFAQASSSGPGIPPGDAVKMLVDGNARYQAGQAAHKHQNADRRSDTAKNGQKPIATILGCSDSRAPLEVLFDQGVGDIFVIRVAGNVAGPDEMASIEYGVGHLGTPVLLVLGHTACGAVTASVQKAKVHGNIPFLIKQIDPAVARAKSGGDPDLLNASIKANVWLTIENVYKKSAEVRELVRKGQLQVIGGVYDLESGSVAWLGQHPAQARLLSLKTDSKK